MGQINKNYSFTRWGRVLQGTKGWRWGKKTVFVMWNEAKLRQDKTMHDGGKDPILWPGNGNELGSKQVF